MNLLIRIAGGYNSVSDFVKLLWLTFIIVSNPSHLASAQELDEAAESWYRHPGSRAPYAELSQNPVPSEDFSPVVQNAARAAIDSLSDRAWREISPSEAKKLTGGKLKARENAQVYLVRALAYSHMGGRYFISFFNGVLWIECGLLGNPTPLRRDAIVIWLPMPPSEIYVTAASVR